MASLFVERLGARRRSSAPRSLTDIDDTITRMTRKTTLTIAAAVLAVLVGVAVFVPVPYVVMSPGVTENTLGTFGDKPVISIKGHKTYPTSGHLDLTTVSVTSPDSHPRLPDILRAWWSSDEIVLPRDVVYPPQESTNAVVQQNQNAMLDSQSDAKAVGLSAAGIDAVKVDVAATLAGSPAKGVLEKGDEIDAVNGKTVASVADIVAAVSSLAPGSPVTLAIKRGGSDATVKLVTAKSPTDPSKSVIGVSLTEVFKPTFKVNIDLGQQIGGPSAGLMFSLGIYDLLTPGKLTGGRYIAGTGTIDLTGKVGPIGGIQQKIAGAYANGATIFLVPAGDCSEAGQSSLAGKLDLIKVSTMSDAIHALEAYDNGTESTLTRCGS
jgi:PDZ domain-containing protein